MRTRYREDKATQAAAKLLRLRGDSMSHLKLIKLLYLVDREALIRWGRPVTYDSYYSMPHGPVLTFTYDRIVEGAAPDEESYWGTFIAERRNHEVTLRRALECPTDQLSPAEEELIEEVFARFGRMSRWELRDYSHTLPEWQDPRGSSLPIRHRDILACGGFSPAEIAAIEAELESVTMVDSLLVE